MTTDTSEQHTPSVAWKRAGFGWYWSSMAVSGTGSAVSAVVVPITAVTLLHATAGEVAILTALGLVPSLLLQVWAGAWADKLAARVRAMVLADLLSAGLMALIPALWWAHSLNYPWLAAVIGVKAVVGVFQFAASAPVVVDLVPREELVRANGRINGTRSATDVVGKALGGGLLAVVAAPAAVVADALSYLLSGILAARIRVKPDGRPGDGHGESQGEPPSQVPTRALLLRLLRRADLWSVVPISLANGLAETVIVIYCIRTLHIHADALGALLSLGAFGGIAGGFLAGRVIARLGPHAITLGILAVLWSLTPLVLARPGWSAGAATVNYELAAAFGGTIVITAVFGSLQGSAEPGTIARIMGLANNALQAAALAGIAAGGAIAQLTSPRIALTCGLAAMAVITVPTTAAFRHSGSQADEES